MKLLFSLFVLALAGATPLAAITLEDLSPTSLSGTGKTLELTFTGGDTVPSRDGLVWTITFEKNPANQVTIRNFPGHTAAALATWVYTGAAFPESHNYVFAANDALGSKGGDITLWISEGGAKFYLTVDGVSDFGDVTFKDDSGPDIAVQQPAGTDLTDGSSKKPFGTAKIGTKGKSKTFTIKNTGKTKLSGLSIKKSGANKGDFIVGDPEKTSLAKGASTTFKVTFKPSSKGTKNAAIAISSNDPDEDPFDIKLSGEGVK
jgi:hypothetical protein